MSKLSSNSIPSAAPLQATIMLRWKERGEMPDEMTVLELLDPIDRVLDVKEMVEFMGIDPIKEPHLLWLPKMNVLEALPPGWKEQELADGRIIYLNIEGGYHTEAHPNDAEVLQCSSNATFPVPLVFCKVKSAADQTLPGKPTKMTDTDVRMPRGQNITRTAQHIKQTPHGLQGVLSSPPTRATPRLYFVCGMLLLPGSLAVCLFKTQTLTSLSSCLQYKQILDRERGKLKPYMSIQPQFYDWPVTRHKRDVDKNGNPLETPVIPNTGTYIDFYDVYGRHFW